MPSRFHFRGVNLRENVRSILEGVRTCATYYGKGLYQELFSKQVFLWAQAIAFKALVTFVPIVILVTGLIGQVLESDDAFRLVAPYIRGFLPQSQNQQLINFLSEVRGASKTILSVGSVGLLLAAVSLVNTLRIAVSNAFGHRLHEHRSLLRRYAFDARMVFQVGLVFLLTIGLTVFLPPFFSDLLIEELGGFLHQIPGGWQQTIRVLLPFFFTVAVFFQLYYFVPRPHPDKRSVLAGTMVAALLWETSKQAFTYYASYVGRFGRYSAGSEGLGAVGNTFGLLVAFMVWVYLSGVLLIVGAVVVSLRERRHGTVDRSPGDNVPEASPLADPRPFPVHDPVDPAVAEESRGATDSSTSGDSSPSSSPSV